jgi:poly(A) polymerase
MGPSEILPPQPWMADPATRAVIGALEAAGGAGCARFVGGCVRNTLIGASIDDLDIATQLQPQAVMRALDAAGLKWAPTGVEHGTVTAIAQGRGFEVTSLRRDVATDGRRAVVAFTTDWLEDAQRRDFRLNALYLDAQGGLYDPTGQGAADARAGRIVFVGEADTRIREDYLRILRFFRFQAWYGRGAPDAAGLDACARLSAGLAGLSAERISKELLKLLAAPDPVEVVDLMQAAGVLAVVAPPADPPRLEALVALQRDLGLEAAPELRLAALVPSDAAGAAALAKRLRLSNAQKARLVAAAGQPSVAADLTPAQARRAIYRIGAAAFLDRALLAWAASGAPSADASWRALIDQARSWRVPEFPVAGRDLAALGLPSGPAMGEALKALEAWWIEQDFRPSRAGLLDELRRRIGTPG